MKKTKNAIEHNDFNPIVSIIIPCYNAEVTILRALQSLEKQIYDSFEIITINDGSKDETENIIKKFKLNTKMKINNIFQENKGVSVARNRGILESKGDYLLFLDADDIYHQDYISSMLKILTRNNLDTVYCLFTHDIHSVFNAKDETVDSEVDIIDQAQLMHDFMYKKGKIGFWAFIYKKKIIVDNNIRFTPNAKYGEDIEFTWKYILRCKNAAVLNKELYGYYNNPSSAVNSVNWSKVDLLRSINRVEDVIHDVKPEFYEEFCNYMYPRAVWSVAKSFAQGKRMDLYNRFHEEFDVEPYMEKMATNSMSLIVKFTSKIYLISPKLYYLIIRFIFILKNNFR